MLSGGERARLALSRLVLTGPSWLAMDEPTNHLDLAGRTALEEMLGAFEGTLVCISHDRAFLDGLCTTIVEVNDGRARTFRGNYSAYRTALGAEQNAAQDSAARARTAEKKRSAAQKQKASARPNQRKPQKQKKRASNPYLLKKVEAAIISLEGERETLLSDLGTEAIYRDAEAMKERQVRLAEVERDLEEKNAQWEEWAQ